jgi:hypothetical protein
VLLSTLLQDILHPSHHLLNVLLQIANKLDLHLKKFHKIQNGFGVHAAPYETGMIPWAQWPEREADRLPESNAKVKNGQSYNHIFPFAFILW